MPERIGDEPQHSSAPQPRRPSGVPQSRAASLLALLRVLPARGVGPPRIRSGSWGNAPRAPGGPAP